MSEGNFIFFLDILGLDINIGFIDCDILVFLLIVEFVFFWLWSCLFLGKVILLVFFVEKDLVSVICIRGFWLILNEVV